MTNNNSTPTLRMPKTEPVTAQNAEETLVADDRATLTPSQMVEQKLIGRLKQSDVLVSHIQRQLKPGCR
jgi:hypothetical protein